MKIEPVQVSWSDNWMYLITDEATQEGAVVDPWDNEGMAKKVKDAGVKVSTRLVLSRVGQASGANGLGDERDHDAPPR